MDLINFAIPGAGPHTISLASALPPVTEAVTINGYSESLDETTPASANTLAVGNNAVLKIELDGTNAHDGLRIQASNSTVKGLIINRFDNPGVWLQSGATGNFVQGNFIGTDVTGRVTDPDGIPNNGDELGNLYGVFIEGSSNTVGGTQAGARNIISGNELGVFIILSGGTGNQVEGNYIGTDKDGDDELGNDNNGVTIEQEADNNTIGGTTAGAGNIISGNGGDGVEVSYYRDSNNPEDNDPTSPTGNSILSNSVYDNDALGIDLFIPPNQLPGVTNNDPKDPDTGPNNQQNFPKLTSAMTDGTTTTITGTLNSRPRKSFTIQFFSSPGADPSFFGEGKTFLGEIQVKTNRNGERSFSAQVDAPPTGENVITATATRVSTGDTSEFSSAVSVS